MLSYEMLKKFAPFFLLTTVLSAAVGGGAGYFAGLQSSTLLREPQQQPSELRPIEPQSDHEAKIIDAVNRASPAVVSVIATKDLPVLEQEFTNPFQDDDFFNQFFGDPFEYRVPQYRQNGTEKREVSGGTGFLVSSDGLIVTNRHVVDIEGAEYTVLTNDGERFEAEVLARDPVHDLAVVKIKKDNLPTVPLGDASNLQIGQTVIAIGNALGEFQNTVSVGVVAGLGRTIQAGDGQSSETIEDAIQTDAAINRGNSGGPLLNLKGEVIGINTAIVIGSQNIGFAILVNRAKKAVDDVKARGKITYPWLGVRYLLVSEELQKKNDLPYSYGALVLRGEERSDLAVIPGSPADKAGIQENDIILEVDGVRVDEKHSLASLIQQKQVGDTVTLKVYSKGQEKTVSVTLEERK